MTKCICILIIFIFLCGCLPSGFENIYSGKYYLNVSQEGTEQIYSLVYGSLYEYELNYGECEIDHVLIVMKAWPFYVGGIRVAGVSYGGLINVGVHPESECETMGVVIHELYHSCKGIYSYEVDGYNWTWDIYYIIQQAYVDGKCRIDLNGLYENYVWE